MVGLERTFNELEDSTEVASDQRDLSAQAGVRTFAALALLGFCAAQLGEIFPMVPAVVLGGATLLLVMMYFRTSPASGVGITTEVAAIATCALGMLCGTHHQLAAVLALLLTVVLASKRFAHATVRKMRPVELYDTLKFLAIILLVLPLLPNRPLDPYGAFNPYKIGVLVVLICGISFVGYFLTRILGARRGLGLAGVLGGLTSSTAVTAAMAAQAKERPALGPICAFSTIAANATMFVRVLVVVAVLDRPLFFRMAWSIGAMTVVAAGFTGVLWMRAKQREEGPGSSPDGSSRAPASSAVPLKNPFSLGPALKFGIFFVVILALLKLAKSYLGDQGLYAAAGISGLADVDAITLSVTEQARGGSLAREVASVAITIAVVSNSITKSGIAIYTGGWRFGRLVAASLGAATIAGLVTALLL